MFRTSYKAVTPAPKAMPFLAPLLDSIAGLYIGACILEPRNDIHQVLLFPSSVVCQVRSGTKHCYAGFVGD